MGEFSPSICSARCRSCECWTELAGVGPRDVLNNMMPPLEPYYIVFLWNLESSRQSSGNKGFVARGDKRVSSTKVYLNEGFMHRATRKDYQNLIVSVLIITTRFCLIFLLVLRPRLTACCSHPLTPLFLCFSMCIMHDAFQTTKRPFFLPTSSRVCQILLEWNA